MNATFDFGAFMSAVDSERRAEGLRWYDLADVLWEQSANSTRTATIIRFEVELCRVWRRGEQRRVSTRCSYYGGSVERPKTL